MRNGEGNRRERRERTPEKAVACLPRRKLKVRRDQVRPIRTPVKRTPGLVLRMQNGVWWITGTYLGVRVRQSTGERERIEAEKRLAEVMVQTRDRAVGALGRRRTLAEVAPAYLAHGMKSEAIRKSVGRLLAPVGPRVHVDEVNQELLNRLRSQLLSAGASQATYKRMIVTPMRALCNFAAAEFGPREGCPRIVFHRIRDGIRRTVTVRPDQAEAMIGHADANGMFLLAFVIQLAVCEGLRRGELHSLDWQFVDLERRTLTVRDVKARPEDVKDRVIGCLRGRTVDALRKWQERTGIGSGKVMRRLDKETFATEESFGRLMNGQLKTVGTALGLPDTLHLHVLRHTAASWHYRVTPDLEAVKERMDWSTVSATHRYVHLLHGVEPEEVLAFWR